MSSAYVVGVREVSERYLRRAPLRHPYLTTVTDWIQTSSVTDTVIWQCRDLLLHPLVPLHHLARFVASSTKASAPASLGSEGRWLSRPYWEVCPHPRLRRLLLEVPGSSH